MKAHIDAILQLLAPADAYYVDVPAGAGYPYFLVWSTAGQPGSAPELAAVGDLEDLIGITSVDTTPANALVTASAGRALLDGAHPAVTGRQVTLTLVESQRVQVDRDYRIPGTNTHPAFAVDLYRLMSTPAPLPPGD